MATRAPTPPRTLRVIAALAISLTATVSAPAGAVAQGMGAEGVGAGAAGTSPSGTAGSDEATLQARAQEIAAQIQADGEQLDQLSESYNGAEIHLQQIDAEEASVRASMARISAQVDASHQEMKEQAILDYLAGGGQLLSVQSGPAGLAGPAGSDPSITVAYADIIVGGQKRAVQTYRSSLAQQTAQEQQLTAAETQASITLADVTADRSSANALLAAQKLAYASVKGQLAVVVAQVQAQQTQAEQTEEEASLAQSGQLPPGASGNSGSSGAGSAGSAESSGSSGAAAPSTLLQAPERMTAPTTAPTGANGATPAGDRVVQPGPTTDPSTAVTTAPEPPTTTGSSPPAGRGSSGSGDPPQAPGVNAVLAYARAQLGKPYQWAGAGPNSFDCSGLVMMAWDQAGVYFPHLAQDQYDMTARIPMSDLIPGDLVFFGTPSDVYHVGIYIGGGDMIDAPETGQNVSIQSIYWTNLLGAGRVDSQS